MSESQELDSQVAETIMGWYRDPKRRGPLSDWHEAKCSGKGRCAPWCGFNLPSYSQDIPAAFQVRAEMRKLGFTFRLSDADNGQSAVSFFHDDAEQGLAGAAVAETDALAICLAALEAVKEKALAASG